MPRTATAHNFLSTWAELYPRHIQIHYGKYKREELYDAARRSRVCAYLADDDHGPLALQEILLAGCPVVGVQTGSPFIEDGVTGFFVYRMPPGGNNVKSERDRTLHSRYLDALTLSASLDRQGVHAAAALWFATKTIVSVLIQSLKESANLPNYSKINGLEALH